MQIFLLSLSTVALPCHRFEKLNPFMNLFWDLNKALAYILDEFYAYSDFPVYHTAFDSYDWMINYGDPLFRRHVAG